MTDKNLWGNTDVFADVPKFLQPKVTFDGTSDVAANGTFTVPAHPYVNGDKVKYTSTSAAGGFTTGNDYFVVARTADTLQLAATSGGTAIARGTANGAATDSLQQVATDCFFIDQEESGVVASEGINNAGWNLHTARTVSDGAGGTYTRYSSECLVAMGVSEAAAGDAEDTTTPDATITIPNIAAVNVANGATATFTVAPTSTNPDAVFSYVWQFDADAGTPATNVAAGNHTDFAVADNGTLTFTAATAQSLDTYHVVVTATFPGGSTAVATSNAVALTVS